MTRRELCGRLLVRQLERILRLVDLEVDEKRVDTDCFALATSSRPTQPAGGRDRISYQSLASYVRTEPRLEMISRGLRRALRLGSFRGHGRLLAVDGFRLRDLRQWSRYPGVLNANIGSISSHCNCDCEFCFEKDARHSDMGLGRGLLTRQEVETRCRYYSRETQTGLLPAERAYLEPFVNRHCLEILERVHAHAPDEMIVITTNGSFLTEEVVAGLARLKPIVLGVSLNASSVEMRLRSMRDHSPQAAATALACPGLLRKYEIPFVASYVPWPSKPLSDMEEAIRLIDRCDGVLARVCMPSWARWMHSEPPFEHLAYWNEILNVVERIRSEVTVPIYVAPNMCTLHTMRPVVHGTVKHSPAAMAGMRYGDIIQAVDGQPVLTRPEVAALLDSRARDLRATTTRFTVERNGNRLEIEIPHVRDPEEVAYPSKCLLGYVGPPCCSVRSLGIYLPDGFQLSSFVRLKEIVEDYPGKPVLFYISPLAGPHFREGMSLLGETAVFLDIAEVYVEPLWPRYWGGNVMVGDLWTNRDIIEHTRKWMERTGVRPEVIIVPNTYMSDGGRDLLGRPYIDVERALDVEVRLLQCNRINN
jgi:hypothetical protein